MKINRDSCYELSSEEKIKGIVKSFAQLHSRRMKLPFMLVITIDLPIKNFFITVK